MAEKLIRGPKVKEKLAELCAAVLESRQFKDANTKIEAFLGDPAARDEYVALMKLRSRLQEREARGFQLTAGELNELDKVQSAAEGNPLISEFMDATTELERIKRGTLAYLETAFELIRVPTDKEVESGAERD